MPKPVNVVVDITQANFPTALPALQGFADAVAADAQVFVENMAVPDEIKPQLFFIVCASVLRDGIIKLEQGATKYLNDSNHRGQVAHLIENEDGTCTPKFFKPREAETDTIPQGPQ